MSYAQNVLLPPGRFEEARKHYQRALELDPTDHYAPANLGALLYCARHTEESLAYFDQAAHLEANSQIHRLFRARALEVIPARRAEGIHEYRRFLADASGFQRLEASAGLAYVLARDGQSDEAHELLRELSSHSEETRAAVSLAWVYTALGEHEQAVHWLEVGYERRDPWMIWIKVDPRLEPLHMEKGFQSILRRMNLE